ncbi:hypothetical protein Cob_v005844 [Colletotrichum orbiculare MAFF 240422]|uniref:Uncharacterized protein n=1 Tax=Colletotrichum orbiculare (strain 104-T / ATCC 96160 / CBS 514.97 / LARS 414 / MAFF 240422) TaxID=1213857 RepID=A0A484FTC7_COLOR|nr:hypothetical protein Cob_v005844 [Colletotrichum orbiculare MAFF 240422]
MFRRSLSGWCCGSGPPFPSRLSFGVHRIEGTSISYRNNHLTISPTRSIDSQCPPHLPDSGPGPFDTAAGHLARSRPTSGPSFSAPSVPSSLPSFLPSERLSATTTRRPFPSHTLCLQDPGSS